MPVLNISEAARRAGVDRSTIQRAIRAGRLSATRDARGRRGVDLAEIERVFGVGQSAPGAPAAVPEHATVPDAVLEVLREQLRDAREEKARLLALLEREQAGRERLEQRLLPPPEGRLRRWWARWWG